MKQIDPLSDKAEGISVTMRAIGALGRLTLNTGRTVFSTLGGMTLLLGETLSSAARLFAPRRGRDAARRPPASGQRTPAAR